jgi:hypothetical protein
MLTSSDRLHRIHALLDQISSSPWAHDIIELAMATVISAPIAGSSDMVWLIIPGNPSGGKTMTMSGLRSPRILHVDNLTENALASGYVPKGRQTKKTLRRWRSSSRT